MYMARIEYGLGQVVLLLGLGPSGNVMSCSFGARGRVVVRIRPRSRVMNTKANRS